MPVDTQRESATDGRFSPKEPGWLVWDDASLCEQLHQAYLAFLIPAQRNHPHHPAVSRRAPTAIRESEPTTQRRTHVKNHPRNQHQPNNHP